MAKLVVMDKDNRVVARPISRGMHPYPYARSIDICDERIRAECSEPETDVFEAFDGELSLTIENLICLNYRYREVVGND